MFFSQSIDKAPFSRGRLKDISFEPSRHPSVLDELPYRESFFDPDPESFFSIITYTYKIRFSMNEHVRSGFYGMANKPLPFSAKAGRNPVMDFYSDGIPRIYLAADCLLIRGRISTFEPQCLQILTSSPKNRKIRSAADIFFTSDGSYVFSKSA